MVVKFGRYELLHTVKLYTMGTFKNTFQGQKFATLRQGSLKETPSVEIMAKKPFSDYFNIKKALRLK